MNKKIWAGVVSVLVLVSVVVFAIMTFAPAASQLQAGDLPAAEGSVASAETVGDHATTTEPGAGATRLDNWTYTGDRSGR